MVSSTLFSYMDEQACSGIKIYVALDTGLGQRCTVGSSMNEWIRDLLLCQLSLFDFEAINPSNISTAFRCCKVTTAVRLLPWDAPSCLYAPTALLEAPQQQQPALYCAGTAWRRSPSFHLKITTPGTNPPRYWSSLVDASALGKIMF